MDNPANFSKYNLNTIKHAEYFLNKHRDLFQWGDKEDMLEVGGGDGVIANTVVYPFVEKYLNQLIGSDYSQEAVDVANKKYSKSNLSFVQMDIADLEVGKKYLGKFGHIFAFYCFQLVKPSEAWAENVYKMLTQNGEVFATLNLTPNCFTKVIGDQKSEKSTPWIKYVENCPDIFVDYGPNHVESVTKILENAGFTIKLIEIDTVDVIFTDDETLQGTFASVNPIAKTLPDNLRKAYMEDYLKKCMSYSVKNENGHYNSKMKALVFLASKQI